MAVVQAEGSTACNDHAVPRSIPENTAENTAAAGVSSRPSDAAPRTVALHGFTQTGRSWAVVAGLLGNALITPDLPAHGAASDERPIDLDDAADLVAERVAPELGGRPTWWIGYSLGGRVLLHLALRRPDLVAGLVLVSTTAGIDDADERTRRVTADNTLADEIERDGAAPFLDRWLAQPLFATLTTTDDDRAERLRNTTAGMAASLRSCGTGTQRPLWNRLAEITVPVIVVTGSLDTKFTPLGHRLAATLPRAVHRQLVGAGHACHLEQPGEFIDAIRYGRQLLRA